MSNSPLVTYTALSPNYNPRTEKITKMKQLSIFTNTNSTYSELLFKKIIEVSYVKDISEFLIKEYNRLKYLEN